MGIGGSVLSILTQFLSNRSRHIMVDGCQSKLVDVSGVKVKSSMARSLPVENLLPQNVGSIINYLQ